MQVLGRLLRLGVAGVLAVGLVLLSSACDRRSSQPATKGAVSAQATPPGPGGAFTILAGSELKDLEPAIIDAARRSGVAVSIRYAGTLDMVERVNEGEQVDAVLPPNGAYAMLGLARKPAAREKLFYSRIALSVKASKLDELGWKKNVPTWADIASAAGSGRLHYAMTNPTSSNSGMSALFAVASASAGKTEDLAVGDVKAEVLKAFLSGQTLTAGSSGWLAEAFVTDPSRLDAMVNYEAVILRANEKLPPADRLALVYPKDGMISADYPLMLLEAGRRTDFDKIVAALKSTSFQSDALAPMFIRPSNPEATAASALPTAPVAELAFPNRIEVIDAVLASYQSDWRRPSTSIFVLDISGSMRGPRIEAVRDALKGLTAGAASAPASIRYAAFQPRERVALIAFDDKVEDPVWIRFGTGDVGDARAELQRRVDALEARGGTAIFSAVAVAEELARDELRREPGRFVSILLLTDGANNTGLSLARFRERYAQGAPARVFPILFGEGRVAEMDALAQATGGRVFDGRGSRLALVFKDIRGYQ
jgi:Ca-activated chloride channel family protein